MDSAAAISNVIVWIIWFSYPAIFTVLWVRSSSSKMSRELGALNERIKVLEQSRQGRA
jgi:hypothetical protein